MGRSFGLGSDMRHGVEVMHELAGKYFKAANFQPPCLLSRFQHLIQLHDPALAEYFDNTHFLEEISAS